MRVPGAFWSPDSRFLGFFAGGVLRNRPIRWAARRTWRSGGFGAFSFHYDVAPDGKRFIALTTPQADALASSLITVVLNWQAALKK